MEFKQNKYLPAEKQVVTADPDATSVSITVYYALQK
jgi:protein phosphatase 1G